MENQRPHYALAGAAFFKYLPDPANLRDEGKMSDFDILCFLIIFLPIIYLMLD